MEQLIVEQEACAPPSLGSHATPPHYVMEELNLLPGWLFRARGCRILSRTGYVEPAASRFRPTTSVWSIRRASAREIEIAMLKKIS